MKLRMTFREISIRELKFIFILFLFAFFFHLMLGNFQPIMVSDSPSYLQFKIGSTNEYFAAIRTPFYGWLADLLNFIQKDYSLLPWLNFISLLIGSYALIISSIQYGLSKEAAYSLGLCLPVSNPAILYVGCIMPEILSISFGILGLSFILIISSKTNLDLKMLFLASLCTCISYLMKPVFALLIPFLSVLYLVLLNIRRTSSVYNLSRNALILLIFLSLPLIVYSSIRLLKVDDFNIVSYSGVNSLGLSGQILDSETVTKLPFTHQKTAKIILKQKNNLEDLDILIRIPLNSTNRERLYSSAVVGYFDIFARNYDHVTSIFPKLQKDNENWVEFNHRMSQFSKSVIYAEPIKYFLYIFGATIRFFGLLVGANASFVFFSLIFIIFIFVIVFAKKEILISEKEENGLRFPSIILIFIIVSAWILMNMIPSVLIAFPARRYVDNAGILMAALPAYLFLRFFSAFRLG